MTTLPPTPPRAVLDTNVVLDWLLFRDRDCTALADAIITGTVAWIATRPMRDEFAYVVADGRFERWRPAPSAMLALWDRHCTVAALPDVRLDPSARCRCTDPDDQKFVDLAAAAPARWLVSRDRAVLKLRRRLGALGVDVTPPGRWTLAFGHGTHP